MQLPSESVLEGSRSLSYGNTRSTKGKQEETLLLSRRTTCDCLLVKCVFRNGKLCFSVKVINTLNSDNMFMDILICGITRVVVM